VTTAFTSDLPAVDAYIAEGYDSVRGMSSRFSATILGWLMGHQSRNGVTGHVAEIGTFEGRLFIALALGLQPDERALGIDSFDWPNDGLLGLFQSHLRRFGLSDGQVVAHKGRSEDLTPDDVRRLLGGGAVRLFHIDGDHSREALTRDLDLAAGVLHPQGLIVLDDMLHPGYPLLIVAVHDWLERHPEYKVLAVIDREDIVAAAKFVLCRADAVALYEAELMARFPGQHYVLGSEWERYWCIVLTPHPRIAEVD
jgi:predicted O-methyltransferase YrrM